jgi:hypothetical protein
MMTPGLGFTAALIVACLFGMPLWLALLAYAVSYVAYVRDCRKIDG